MKKETYHQMPIPPAIGIGTTGIDTFTISPDIIEGNISRVKFISIDLLPNTSLDIDLGPGQDRLVSIGNESGSIEFREGLIFNQNIIITVSGNPGTIYSVRMITEVESPEVVDVRVTNPSAVTPQSSLPVLLAIGLAGAALLLAMRK